MQGIAKTEEAEIERRKKISVTMSKKTKSEEHKKKIKETINAQRGIRRKIMLDRWQDKEFKRNLLEKRKKQWTKESRDKVKNTLKNKWEENKFKDYMLSCRKTPYNDSEYIKKLKESRAKQIFPIKDTKIEVKIQMFLKELGYEFFAHQYIKGIEHGYQCDILIPLLNLVIECDGNYWHKYPIGNEIDNIRTKELIEQGFKVLRLWESEIKVMNIDQFEERLKC